MPLFVEYAIMTKVSTARLVRQGCPPSARRRLTALPLAVLLAAAVAPLAPAQAKVEPNAGTGPYIGNLLFGFGNAKGIAENRRKLLLPGAQNQGQLIRQIRAESRFGTAKWGLISGPDSASAIHGLTYAFGEREAASVPDNSAFFASAAAIAPLSGGGTGRLGLGVAVGDARRHVAVLGVASYLSPSAVDVEATITGRLGPRDHQERGRLLLDHVRSGDLWYTVGARWITESNSPRLSTGQIFEGALTYARPTDDVDKLGPTITISWFFSDDKALLVDEMGIEMRSPFGERAFLSARYGTRGHVTIALEKRF